MLSKVWPHWILTAAILLGLPAASFIYWPLVLESGVLPTDGDSISIPMFESVLLMFTASPVVSLIAWLCLRRYNPATRLLAWRRDQPVRTILATVMLGAPAAVIAVGLIVETWLDWPWYEQIWTAYSLWVVWLLGLRSALIDQLDRKNSPVETADAP